MSEVSIAKMEREIAKIKHKRPKTVKNSKPKHHPSRYP